MNVASTVVVAFLIRVTLQYGVQLISFEARHSCTHMGSQYWRNKDKGIVSSMTALATE